MSTRQHRILNIKYRAINRTAEVTYYKDINHISISLYQQLISLMLMKYREKKENMVTTKTTGIRLIKNYKEVFHTVVYKCRHLLKNSRNTFILLVTGEFSEYTVQQKKTNADQIPEY